MIANSKIFKSFGDCKSSTFDSYVMISYPKFGGDTFMFRILNMINEFRVLCFIFKNGVELLFICTYQIELVVFKMY